MMTRIALPMLAITATLAMIAGCGRHDQSTEGAHGVDAAQPAAAIPVHGAITTTPSSVASCGAGVSATVTWDARRAHSDTNDTAILVGESFATAKLFAEGGNQGSAKTGPWIRAGTMFILEDKRTGKVLDTLTIGSHPCPSKNVAGSQ